MLCFHGNCATLQPGEYRKIDSTLNDRISSARQIGYEPLPPRAVVTSPPVAVVTPPPITVITPPSEDTRIVLHERTRSGVKSVELTDGVRDLDSVGFSNRADSATVYGGVWRLCDQEGGNGTTCVEFGPGYYDHLGALDRNVRSALIVGAARAAMAVPAVAPGVVLYEFPDFAGRSLAIESSEARDLMWQRFAARAGSIRVFGASWMFCTGPNFSGECRTLGPGEYPRLGPDLDRRIASARLVSNGYVGMR